jgi:hypothetical protein
MIDSTDYYYYYGDDAVIIVIVVTRRCCCCYYHWRTCCWAALSLTYRSAIVLKVGDEDEGAKGGCVVGPSALYFVKNNN